MIITCSACLTRYLVEPRTLGVAGRTVRCANCGNTWLQGPPEDAPRRVDVPATAIEQTPGPIRLPAIPAPRRRAPVWPWFLFLVVIGAAIAVAYSERARIVAVWPPAARLYDMVGLAVVPVGDGLQIRVTGTRRADEGGQSEVTITGEIVNQSDRELSVPRLRAVLRDSAERELAAWSFAAAGARLLPGEATTFSTAVKDPSRSASGLSIAFSAED